jgi:lipoprotein-releasing system ATP-binding protein
MEPMLTATNLHKSYRRDKVVVPVLRGLDLDVQPGEFLSVIGASGSGKSTLLHLLGTLDQPDSGTIELDGRRIDNLVLSWFGARRKIKKRAHEIMERVGLSHRLKHKPRELSGGEMQRAAIARALIGKPRILLADEPTGNLDETTGGEIVQLLRSLNRDEGLTIVMVTHNLELVAVTDRMVRIASGRIEPNGEQPLSLLSQAC